MRTTEYTSLPSLTTRFRGFFLSTLAIIFLVSAVSIVNADVRPSTRVILSIDGKKMTFESEEPTLGEAVQKASVGFGKYDALSPDSLTLLTGAEIAATVLRAYPIAIIDGNMEFRTFTGETTVSKILSQLDIKVSDTDVVTPGLDTTIGQGMRIIITRSNTLLISDGTKDIEIGTQGNRVSDVLAQLQIVVRPQDILTPDPSTNIKPGLHIRIVRVDTHEETKTEDIAFTTQTVDDASIYRGTTKVVQTGVNGKREKKFRVTTHNNKEVSRAQLSDVVTKKPTATIVHRGTKERVGRVMTGLGTWYANGNAMTAASRDFAFGTRLRVTNLANGRQVIVVVNDYGPQAGGGRLIDLNKPAFAAIGSLGTGVLNVKVEQLL